MENGRLDRRHLKRATAWLVGHAGVLQRVRHHGSQRPHVHAASRSTNTIVLSRGTANQQITIPNPDLTPERAETYSAMLEYYFEPAGAVSLHVFERILNGATQTFEETAQEAPLGRAETVAREQHVTLLVDADTGDTDKKARVRRGHEPPLPAHGNRVEHERERAHQHARNGTRAPEAIGRPLFPRSRCRALS